MTNPSTQNLNLTDTEYAALLAEGYDPELERQLISLGEKPDTARRLTRFVGLLQEKSPETEEEWDEVMAAWEEVGGYRPEFQTAPGND